MKGTIRQVIAVMLAVCMVLSGIDVYKASADTDTNLANVAPKNNIFLTSNANNKTEGFLTVDNGFSAINACNDNLGNGNNLLGTTSTTDEVAIYINLGKNYDIARAQVFQGSTNTNYFDSYCRKYSVYYSTETVSAANEGNITWNLAGTCDNGTIYSGAKRSTAADVSDAGDNIAFGDTYNARSVKIVFDKASCKGTGTNGNGTGTVGTVSLLSVRIYGEEKETTSDEQTGDKQDDGVTDILFIGNSFMYYNTVWNVVKGLANYNGHNVNVTAVTNGGQNLIYQSTAGNVLDAVKKGNYDIVILQDKVGSNFNMDVLLEGANDIIPIVKQYSPNAKFVFYEPWPTKDQIGTKMSYFTSSYITAAKQFGAKLAPAGEGFYDLYTNYGLDYYCSDNRHPQPLGTFNSASTIYYTLFPEDAQKVYTTAEQSYIDDLINNNVAYTTEGQLASYNLDTINLISALAYKYSHQVIDAVNGNGTYTSISDRKNETTTHIDTPEQTTEDVLFIGNSMTYYNTLCNVVKGIAARKGHAINVTAATNGGQNIIYQSTAENVLNAIKKGGYETVVVQDIVGGFDDAKLQTGVETIIPIIKQYNPNAKVILYMPWPTKDTITGADSLLPYFTNSYIKTAKSVGASFAPAGEAFYELYTDNNLDYYCADNKHPQPLGTFTSATTIYYTMYPNESYAEFTSADQAYLDNLINTNVAYTNEGKAQTYSVDTLNLIQSLGYKYAGAVAGAVNGNEKYVSAAGEYYDIDEEVNPTGIKAVLGTNVATSEFTKANGNIAVGCKAVASTEKQSAGNAIDGNTESRWESASEDVQWLYVDLGAVKAFDTVGFVWEGAYASKYYIQISDDAQNWETISYVTATSNKTVQIDLGKTYNARYVRMFGTKRGTGYGYSFYEMGVWNKANAENPNQPTSGSSQTESATKDGTIEEIIIGSIKVSAISADTENRAVSFSWVGSKNAIKYTTYIGIEENGEIAEAYHNSYKFENVAQLSVDHLKAAAGESVTYTVIGYDADGSIAAKGQVTINIPELSEEEKNTAKTIAKINSDENLAKKGTSFVSSKTGSSIIDGNLNTNWQADPNENPDDDPAVEFFGVDLGSVNDIGTVIVAWENSYATAYDIYVAGEDGVYGTTPVALDVASGTNPIVITELDNVSARYVKVVPTQLSNNAKNYGTCVFELAVLKAEGTEVLTTQKESENITSSEPTTDLPVERPEKPSGLADMKDGTIVWNASSNAVSYKVLVNRVLVGNTASLSYDVSPYTVAAGTYNVEIVAVDKDGVESAPALITIVTEEKETDVPSTEEPSTEEPSTAEPSTEVSSTEVPSTEEPSTDALSTIEPTTQELGTDISTGQKTTSVPATTNIKVKSPGKVAIKKIYKKKKSAKKITFKIKKVSGAYGYQVNVYSSKKNAKKNKKALATRYFRKVKYTLKSKKIRNKKKLYIRIRAYKLDNRKIKKYGSWSKIKKAKIK